MSKNFNISLDYSQNGVLPCDMIEVARKKSSKIKLSNNLTFALSDAHNLPFPKDFPITEMIGGRSRQEREHYTRLLHIILICYEVFL